MTSFASWEKIEAAKQMHAEGASWGVIAFRFGVTRSTAQNWVKRQKLPKKRCKGCKKWFQPNYGRQHCCPGSEECAWKAKRARKKRCEEGIGRGNCIDCGDPLGAGSAWGKKKKRCTLCWHLSLAERVDRRARLIERWWAEGISLAEIAERLNWSRGRLSVEMHRLRENGYNLPYRHTSGKKFPDQVRSGA